MLELIDPVLLESATNEYDVAVAEEMSEAIRVGAAALSVGLAAIASGYAERQIGAAAVGAMAEDPSTFGRGLILTVLPETLVIFAIVAIFLV